MKCDVTKKQKNGMTIKEASEKLGLLKNTIATWVKKHRKASQSIRGDITKKLVKVWRVARQITALKFQKILMRITADLHLY